ncbi:uncharacterized protein LOC124695271 [Lolium rigidum]|uniref:uncharacterized protein LOC124695271 n=1 Tax=Lolium rigidum TaxID=89674 RepID=UPI001F5D564E|nr:uncharacterized protein LOC124695271 [Lolium rigidum]
MEMKLSPGAAGEVHGGGGAGCKKRPPSRLQKKAPASLQVEPVAGAAAQASPAAWADGRTPIPLLSPLVTSPAPLWEGGSAQAEARSGGEAGFSLSPPRHGAHGGERHADEKAKTTPAPGHSGGWLHPAMPTPPPAPAPVASGWRHPAMPAPVAEPATLAPLFKSQCTVEMRNAQH